MTLHTITTYLKTVNNDGYPRDQSLVIIYTDKMKDFSARYNKFNHTWSYFDNNHSLVFSPHRYSSINSWQLLEDK